MCERRPFLAAKPPVSQAYRWGRHDGLHIPGGWKVEQQTQTHINNMEHHVGLFIKRVGPDVRFGLRRVCVCVCVEACFYVRTVKRFLYIDLEATLNT